VSRQPGEPPRYRQIADDLRERIERGEFGDAGRITSEKELIKHYDVAQGTIRQALGVLRDEGLTEARHGAGVYVRAYKPIVRNALRRLRAEQWQGGHSVWELDVEDRDLKTVDVQIEQLPAAPEIARALGAEPGAPVWRRSRRYVVDDAAVMRAVSYIPRDLAEGTRITQVDTGPGGIYARLAEAGHGPKNFREELRCRMPSSVERDDLGLAAATPVVELTRYAYDSDGRVVEVNRLVLDSSRYLLVYDFPS
jgi:GntR family transcriptional regulator